eukprot:772130-Prymnesium_polylepis.1
MPAVARGERVIVPALVIPQAELAWLARQLIWDTSDPDDCWLQWASTADTVEPQAHSCGATFSGQQRRASAAVRRTSRAR